MKIYKSYSESAERGGGRPGGGVCIKGRGESRPLHLRTPFRANSDQPHLRKESVVNRKEKRNPRTRGGKDESSEAMRSTLREGSVKASEGGPRRKGEKKNLTKKKEKTPLAKGKRLSAQEEGLERGGPSRKKGRPPDQGKPGWPAKTGLGNLIPRREGGFTIFKRILRQQKGFSCMYLEERPSRGKERGGASNQSRRRLEKVYSREKG